MLHLLKAASVFFLIGLLAWAGLHLDMESNTILWLTFASVVVIGFITLERQSREIKRIRELLEDHDESKVIRDAVSPKQVSR